MTSSDLSPNRSNPLLAQFHVKWEARELHSQLYACPVAAAHHYTLSSVWHGIYLPIEYLPRNSQNIYSTTSLSAMSEGARYQHLTTKSGVSKGYYVI